MTNALRLKSSCFWGTERLSILIIRHVPKIGCSGPCSISTWHWVVLVRRRPIRDWVGVRGSAHLHPNEGLWIQFNWGTVPIQFGRVDRITWFVSLLADWVASRHALCAPHCLLIGLVSEFKTAHSSQHLENLSPFIVHTSTTRQWRHTISLCVFISARYQLKLLVTISSSWKSTYNVPFTINSDHREPDCLQVQRCKIIR